MSDDVATPDTSAVSYPDPYAQLCVELADTARRHIRIYNPTLAHEVFDSAELSSAIAGLARRSRQCDVRILISDSRYIIDRGHRLLTLARRLSSTVKIQKLSDHPELPKETFLIRDDSGIIYKPLDAEHEGFYEPDSRSKVAPFLERFDALWNRSAADGELRQLQL